MAPVLRSGVVWNFEWERQSNGIGQEGILGPAS